jgi:hypothetical protein
MNIQTVASNLRTTIAGKEQMLALYKEKLEIGNYFKQEIKVNQTPEKTTIKFLETNIDELKRILQDVEQCIPKEPEFDESDSEEVRNLIRMGR